MKTLIINASPRKNGGLSKLLEAMREATVEKGEEAEVVHIADLKVAACKACMACRTKGRCILPEDDAQIMLEKIRSADLLIVGAPAYWGNMPGNLKVLFDRMVYGFMNEDDERAFPKPLLKGKRAIIVSTCNTPWPFNILMNQSHGCVKALKEILKWSGFKIEKVIERGSMRTKPIVDKDLQRVRRIIAKRH